MHDNITPSRHVHVSGFMLHSPSTEQCWRAMMRLELYPDKHAKWRHAHLACVGAMFAPHQRRSLGLGRRSQLSQHPARIRSTE